MQVSKLNETSASPFTHHSSSHCCPGLKFPRADSALAWAEPGGDAEWGPTHGGPGGDASAWDEGNNGATTSFNDFDDASASAAKNGDNTCRK